MKASKAKSCAMQAMKQFPKSDLEYIIGCIETNCGNGKLSMSLRIERSLPFIKTKLIALGYSVRVSKDKIVTISWG